MKRILSVVFGIGAVMAISATAFAQQPLEYKVTVKAEVVKGSPGDHFLTFDEPVAIPNATLPAGTYIFSVMGSSVVQVSTADRSQQLAMFFTAPSRRIDLSDSYEVTLIATRDRSPRRVTQWFLPYQPVGLEFLYPPAEGVAGR
jgi:hypothetical protein